MFASPVTVLSRRLTEPLDWPDTTFESGDPVEVVARLKAESAVPLRIPREPHARMFPGSTAVTSLRKTSRSTSRCRPVTAAPPWVSAATDRARNAVRYSGARPDIASNCERCGSRRPGTQSVIFARERSSDS